MFRLANGLARMGGRQAAPANAWGEGLVDQPLATLWRPTTWEDVTDDELVFLVPSLSWWRGERLDRGERGGPAEYLTRALLQRAQSTAALIAINANRTRTPLAPHMLAHLKRYLTSLMPCQLQALEGHLVSVRSAHGRPHGGDLQASLIAELTALAYLDRMLSDALGDAAPPLHVSPIVDWPFSLADAIAASASARLNAAYIYTEFACAHELLSLSALLGHLLQGRAVYLPVYLARALLDVLASTTEDDAGAAALRAFADMAGGVDHLTTIARDISITGEARHISPGRPAFARDLGTWNARLAHRIALPGLCPTARA